MEHFMKNITKLGLTALACLVLSACGSHSSLSEKTSSGEKPNLNHHGSDSIDSTDSKNDTLTNTNTNTGIEDTLEPIYGMMRTSDSIANFENLSIEGKNIPLNNDTFFKEGKISFRDLAYDKFVLCCEKYSDVRFGIAYADTANSTHGIYYGNPTKDMPVEGQANYKGHSFLAIRDLSEPKSNVIQGVSTFNVDFANQSLTGVLSHEGYPDISIQARLNDHFFSGNAKIENEMAIYTQREHESARKIDVYGFFAGEGAKEMVGAYRNHSSGVHQRSFGGAFGASQ